MSNLEQVKAALESRIPWIFHGYRGVKKQQTTTTSTQVTCRIENRWNCGVFLASNS